MRLIVVFSTNAAPPALDSAWSFSVVADKLSVVLPDGAVMATATFL